MRLFFGNVGDGLQAGAYIIGDSSCFPEITPDMTAYENSGDEMKIKDLIDEAESLPVEERAMVVDSLLRSLNPPEAQIDRKWAAVAQKRLDEIRSGRVEALSGEQVFEKIWKRFE